MRRMDQEINGVWFYEKTGEWVYENDGSKDEWIKGWLCNRMNRLRDKWIKRWMDQRINGSKDKWIKGWFNQEMNESIGWIKKWMDQDISVLRFKWITNEMIPSWMDYYKRTGSWDWWICNICINLILTDIPVNFSTLLLLCIFSKYFQY